ncbi:uncharacterized protein PV06_11714 [Exophiala oligosperma]|uniref:Uncharacterized protein n=1 Tax=Exophiala oligosperma TaxID=215243 RepID=A0A0D2CY41_9EURO|nr:uncharacterized protein PV06_11714 [Exophiala oligosperma]KIW35978.1 hypothetical protein PV06_11714 [Exophiala oligosperma]
MLTESIPEHIPYELVGQPFYYNVVLFVMARVLSAGALRHYKTWADICSIRKPRGRAHLPLDYEDHCLNMPIFPRCYADGSVDECLTSTSLADHALSDAGYRTGFRESLTFHASRREALFKVDNYGYSINERMRFGAHRNQGTYAAAYQSTISTVDGQATFFELDRQNQRLHELFRGYSLRRNYNHWPTLPEYRRQQLEEFGPAATDQKAVPAVDERGCDMKMRQSLYDQKRQTRDRALRIHQTCPPAEFMISDDFPYESDFVYTRKLMPERDRLAENLFKEGSLRDRVGRTIMDDLVRLLQTKKSQTYCRGLNSSLDVCDICHQQRIGRFNPSTWWSHVYRCRKAAAKKIGQFQEFCFPCSRWFCSLASWKHHAAEHLQPSEELGPLPLKCNIAQFRHTLLRPGFCPECLGDKDAAPDARFRQYTNASEWKMHVRHHMSLRERGRWACSHPRCTDLAAKATWEELFEHLADIHQIPFTVAEREQVKRDESTHEEGQKKQIYRYVSKRKSTTRPKGDDGFIHRSSASMKQQLKGQPTRESTHELKTPRNGGPPLEATEVRRLEVHDSHEEDPLGASVADHDDNSPPPQTTRHSEIVPEDTHALHDCSKAGLNCRDDVSSRGSCHKMPPRAEGDDTKLQTLDAVVVPLQSAQAEGKKRQISDSSSAFASKKAKSLKLSETAGSQRQVNITVEIPPLPADWWTKEEQEHRSPSIAKEHISTRRTQKKAVMPLPEKPPSKKRGKVQSSGKPRRRPRGRPRRIRDPPQPRQQSPVDDHCLSQIRSRQKARKAASVSLSDQPDQDESVSSKDQVTRKWDASDEHDPSGFALGCVSSSVQPRSSSSTYVGLRRKVSATGPTVSPRVLSILDSPDPLVEHCWERSIPLLAECSATSPLNEAEFQHNSRRIPREQLWRMNARDDCLFSQISPGFSSAVSFTNFPIPSTGAGETAGVESFPEFPFPSVGDANDFGQYLCSPSPPYVSFSKAVHNAPDGRTSIDTEQDPCSNIAEMSLTEDGKARLWGVCDGEGELQTK